jgi:hypothetical protein
MDEVIVCGMNMQPSAWHKREENSLAVTGFCGLTVYVGTGTDAHGECIRPPHHVAKSCFRGAPLRVFFTLSREQHPCDFHGPESGSGLVRETSRSGINTFRQAKQIQAGCGSGLAFFASSVWWNGAKTVNRIDGKAVISAMIKYILYPTAICK